MGQVGCRRRTAEGVAVQEVSTLKHVPEERSLVDLERVRPQSAAAREAAGALEAAARQRQQATTSCEGACGWMKVPPAALRALEVPRFAPCDAAALLHLSDRGYCVLKSALEESEVSRAHDLLWDFLPGATGWHRGRMDTWTQQGFAMCGLPHWGIIKARGAGQSELVWYVRTRPSVRAAFAKIWGTDSLISSFDGFNVFLPWHHGFKKTQAGWLHTDQGHAKRGLHTIQGFVALTDQDATTGGLHVIPGSHHLHEDWVTADHPGSPHDFCMVDRPRGHGSALLHLPQQLVTCKAGDLVLWDSRCVHCNTPALEQPTTPEGELLRVAVYVCMMPKSLASECDLLRRRVAYNEGLSSNHWPLFSHDDFEIFRGNALDFQVKSLEDTDDGRQDLVC
eukprot:CAMPEP_0179139324 /NCGR_PEP_ID=MMETSP0796-20121207/66632_1 /TAXON_ID=73915 /ORGANISM="Pyrodinium bahamense, Strain pbaha01" /LENGTH=393 /DNA_ID=CAMNT_0020838753 /DNA_START=67 /DNA_END=1248 /DNA_ORIENTATION=-